jgi:hypothetical protein
MAVDQFEKAKSRSEILKILKTFCASQILAVGNAIFFSVNIDRI